MKIRLETITLAALAVVTGDSYTAKYASANGVLLWQKLYNKLDYHFREAGAVAVDGSGDVVVTGDFYTTKYASADGTALWSKGGGTAVAVDGSGNVVVAGTPGGHYYTLKYASEDGAPLREKRYDGPAAGSVTAVGPGPRPQGEGGCHG